MKRISKENFLFQLEWSTVHRPRSTAIQFPEIANLRLRNGIRES